MSSRDAVEAAGTSISHPRRRHKASSKFCSAVLWRMGAAPWILKKGTQCVHVSNMTRKDQLRALCGVVAGMLVARPSVSGEVTRSEKQMITCIVQRVAAARAAPTLEGATFAEMMCWDGPIRSISFESAVRKVKCLCCSYLDLFIARKCTVAKWASQLTLWSLPSPFSPTS
jgi:hypothetical protein